MYKWTCGINSGYDNVCYMPARGGCNNIVYVCVQTFGVYFLNGHTPQNAPSQIWLELLQDNCPIDQESTLFVGNTELHYSTAVEGGTAGWRGDGGGRGDGRGTEIANSNLTVNVYVCMSNTYVRTDKHYRNKITSLVKTIMTICTNITEAHCYTLQCRWTDREQYMAVSNNNWLQGVSAMQAFVSCEQKLIWLVTLPTDTGL